MDHGKDLLADGLHFPVGKLDCGHSDSRLSCCCSRSSFSFTSLDFINFCAATRSRSIRSGKRLELEIQYVRKRINLVARSQQITPNNQGLFLELKMVSIRWLFTEFQQQIRDFIHVSISTPSFVRNRAPHEGNGESRENFWAQPACFFPPRPTNFVDCRPATHPARLYAGTLAATLHWEFEK